MLWTKKPVPERPLRDELIEARDKLERQIEILQSVRNNPRSGLFPDGGRVLIPELEDQLSEIKAALADLGHSDA